MEFDGFDWDSGNHEKCQKHGISIAAIEIGIPGAGRGLPDKENPLSEQRYRAIGTTAEGRKAFVVFTLRDRDGAMRLRPDQRTIHAQERGASL